MMPKLNSGSRAAKVAVSRHYLAPLTNDKTPSEPVTYQTVMVFVAQYEALVEVLCDGATYGPEPRLSAKYERIRTWMMQNYPHLQRNLLPHVAGPESALWEAGNDVFEQLFSPNTLEAFLATDDGHMIQRIITTRNAIDDLATELRAAG